MAKILKKGRYDVNRLTFFSIFDIIYIINILGIYFMSKIDELLAEVLKAEEEAEAQVAEAESRCLDVKRQSEKKEREIISVAKDVARVKCEDIEKENLKQIDNFLDVVYREGEKKAKKIESDAEQKLDVLAKEIADSIVSSVTE